jgi:hypothetical protein
VILIANERVKKKSATLPETRQFPYPKKTDMIISNLKFSKQMSASHAVETKANTISAR